MTLAQSLANVALKFQNNAVDSMDTKERAIEHLLKPPALQYVRTLKELTKKDPDYVNANRVDVGNIIHGFLAGAGFLWAGEIFEKEWPDILQQALDRLTSKKR